MSLSQSWLKEYIKRCRAGKLTVGAELLQEFDILEELFNAADVTFDPAEAHKRIRFIETRCKHFEAPFAGKPFILELFQKAFIEAVYGFYIDDPDTGQKSRLFQDVLYLVARKNGKTPLVAAICLAEFFCGQAGIKILCSSNDYEQADLLFQAINNMREESPALEKVTRKNIKGIYFGNPRQKKTSGKFSYRNKASIRKISSKTGAKEGRNIGVGAVDEAHELKDNSSIMPIRQALSTQDEPLYFELTTDGFINDGYLDGRLKEARQVLAGELERRRWLIWLYTQDNEGEVWQNEKNWVKSNPGLGVIKKKSFLRGMVEEAKTSTSTRAFVLAKDFNIKQNNAESWLLSEDIARCHNQEFDIEMFRGGFAVGGADLSKSGDLTCARALLMRKGDPVKYTVSQYFIPEAKLESDELKRDDKEKYRQWIKDGYITLSPGNENDFRLVTAWFVEMFKKRGIRFYMTGYDKWSAVYWRKEMEELGFDCKRVDQNWGGMSEPMKLTEKDIKSGLVNWSGNPVDKYCLENTALAMNHKAEIMPVKIQGREDKKIDGAVTLIIAYRIYIDHRSEFLQLVEGGR